MADKEHSWDKLLQIKTTGRDESNADEYHHPYEPTSYCVLDRLVSSDLINEEDVILDYGCGKGRVDDGIAVISAKIGGDLYILGSEQLTVDLVLLVDRRFKVVYPSRQLIRHGVLKYPPRFIIGEHTVSLFKKLLIFQIKL